MPTSITKELIAGIGLVADHKTVELRGGKYELEVRKLSAAETISFIELNDTEDRSKQLETMAQLVCAVCVQSDGEPLFDNPELVNDNFTLEDMTLIVAAATDMEAKALEGKSEPSSAPTA